MWAKWIMRVLAGLYIMGGVVSLFAPYFKALLS
jgi:hypothetical protein